MGRLALDVDAVMAHWHRNFQADRIAKELQRLGMRDGDHYYDPEHERIVRFLGLVYEEDFAVDLGTSGFSFQDIMTDEVFEICEFEISEEWTYMNEMEVLAWAAL